MNQLPFAMETQEEIANTEQKLLVANQSIEQMIRLRDATQKYLDALKRKQQHENIKETDSSCASQNKR